MRKRGRTAPDLPPPTAWQCWRSFLIWALGLPLAVAGALAVIWAALWVSGSAGLSNQAIASMMTVLGWLALIVLLYPVALVLDLRDGLRAARQRAAQEPTQPGGE